MNCLTSDSIDYKLLSLLKKTLTYNHMHYDGNLTLNPTTDNYEHLTSTFSRYQLPTLNIAKKRFSSIPSYKWNRLPKQVLSPAISPNSFKRKLNASCLRETNNYYWTFFIFTKYRKCIIILTIAFSK